MMKKVCLEVKKMDKEEKIKVLQDIVRIKSVNGNEEEVASYLQQLLKEHRIHSQLISYSEGRCNLIAEIGSEGPILGFTGHMDVVDAGEEHSWTFPPFEAEIDGNRLYGRGSTDMKSGLAAMVIAMIELKDTPLKGKVRLLATVGEEVGELGAEQLTKLGYADDLDGLIIGEPTNYNLMYAHMGSLNYSVKAIGKEAHSSMPEEGINAINLLNQFITRINEKMSEITNKYENQELGRTIHNVTVIRGGNQVNSIPGEAVLQGNIRSIPEYDNEQIIELLQTTAEQLTLELDGTLEVTIDYNKVPVQAKKDSKLIKVIQNQFSEALPLITAAGTTDAAEFTKSDNSFDLVVFGPGMPKLPHQIDEYVEIDNYLDMIVRYQDIAKEYLS
jgi:succinyl-diaminopimelate desuccinylase